MSEQDSVIDAPLTEPAPVDPVATEQQADAADDATKPTAAEPGENHDDSADPEPAELPKGVKKRIDTLTRHKYEQKAEIEAKNARIAELEAQLAPPPPKPEDFADLDSFLEAKAEHLAAQKVYQSLQHKEQAAQLEAKTKAFNERAAKANISIEEFDAAILSVPKGMVTPELASDLLDMEQGPQVAYYLATNIDELARISAMSGRQQAIELGLLAARLVAPKVVPKPAPAPAPRVRTNSAPVEKSVSQMSDAEYREFRRKQDIAAGRLRR